VTLAINEPAGSLTWWSTLRLCWAASPISVIGFALASGLLVEVHFELPILVVLLRARRNLLALRFQNLRHVPSLALAPLCERPDGALAQICAPLLQESRKLGGVVIDAVSQDFMGSGFYRFRIPVGQRFIELIQEPLFGSL
jgi:hypothetical protein